MGWIDAHVHVWTDDLAAYPLAAGHAPSEMAPPSFTPQELTAHAAPCGVDRVVLIQMSFYETDNSFMLDTIARWPQVYRGVAILDYEAADLGGRMARLREGGVRGFRVYHWAGVEKLLDTPAYEPLCGLAGDLRMAVCALTDPEYLPAVGRAAARFPGTVFVVDHLARIGCGRPVARAHAEALCALARHPNCLVKVSAFYALGQGKAPYQDLAPLIRQVRDAFGAERLMWATDCPYQVTSGAYADSLELVARGLPFLSVGEREQILAGTAQRVFFGD